MLGSRRMFWIAGGLLAAITLPGGAVVSVQAAEPVLLAGMDGENIDLAVREVTVTPVRAHVGDVIHVEMVVENKFEGRRTTSAGILANGKEVASQFFTWGRSSGDRIFRLSFDWDTRKVAPGEYRISGEAFVWEDSSPFDNRLDVRQPVLIVPAGAAFPGGEEPGGSVTETDPRYQKSGSSG